jgi:hypothetical protein
LPDVEEEPVADPLEEPVEEASLEEPVVVVMVVDRVAVAEPSELVRVWPVTQVEAWLRASLARLAASEPMELASLSAAVAAAPAAPVRVETAAAPPVCTALAMEVASEAASEPMDWPSALAVE